MKKFYIKLIAVIVCAVVSLGALDVYANNEYSWYIKRHGHELPEFPEETDVLSKYNAFCVDREAYENQEKVIYLTFDAGYENGNVAKILDVLKKENVPAAFFILDNLIYKNPDLVMRMANEGHLVCNHTRKHKNLCNSSREEIELELNALETLCKERTGVEMAKCFRFPEGKYSLEALSSLNDLGYKTFFWSFGYDDWDNSRQPDFEKSKKKILANTHNGEIILLHPTSSTNAEIMSDLIKAWREMGYTFGTLDKI